MKLRIATRRSMLALTQTRWVADQLRALQPGLEVELVEMVTQGDRIQDRSLAEIGGKGLFVSEIEQAILDGKADLAIHSLKDVPAELAVGLIIACVPEREDPRDALITKEGCELDDLEAGSIIGTNSLRRTLQLRRMRNDLGYTMLRGNVDTRLAKLEAGEFRATVLALAGLRRLGLADRPLWAIPREQSIPAVGQGALAVEARADDGSTREVLAKLEHAPSRISIEAERAFLKALGGDCTTPLAGHAYAGDDGELCFDGLVGSVQTDQFVNAASAVYLEPAGDQVAQAQQLGTSVAQTLLDQGAAELIAQAHDSRHDPRRKPSSS